MLMSNVHFFISLKGYINKSFGKFLTFALIVVAGVVVVVVVAVVVVVVVHYLASGQVTRAM